MSSLLEKSLNFKRNVKINFDGGNLTSDSGLILYSEFDERIGFSRTVKDVFYVNDEIKHREHKNEDILIQEWRNYVKETCMIIMLYMVNLCIKQRNGLKSAELL